MTPGAVAGTPADPLQLEEIFAAYVLLGCVVFWLCRCISARRQSGTTANAPTKQEEVVAPVLDILTPAKTPEIIAAPALSSPTRSPALFRAAALRLPRARAQLLAAEARGRWSE